MDVDQVQKVVDDFLREYNGNIPLKFRIENTQEELYGPEATIENVGRIYGAYHPRNQFFVLAASNLQDNGAVRKTLRHEIIGHYGLNILSPKDKELLLEKIAASRNLPSLKDAWQNVDQSYADAPKNVQAEEIFAYIAENEPKGLERLYDQILSSLNKGLRKAGLSKYPISRSELKSLARRISDQIKAGEKQKTFPKDDDSSFSKERSKVQQDEPQGTAQSVQSSNIPPSAISGSGSTERIDAQPTTFKPSDLVLNSKGEETFGEIPQDVADAIKRQAAPIKLEHGNAMWGLEHIKRPQRVSEIESMGYASVEGFVEDVGTNFNEIRKGDHGTLLLVKRNGKDKVAYVKLKPSKDGDFYSVSSATLARKQYIDKKERLWGRAPSNQQAPMLPNAISGQNLSESVAETPAQQSSKEELPVRVAKSDVEIIEDSETESQSIEVDPNKEEKSSDDNGSGPHLRTQGPSSESKPTSVVAEDNLIVEKSESQSRNDDLNLSAKSRESNGMKADDVRAAVEPLINDLHERGTFEVVQSINDLPLAIRLQAKAKLKQSKGENPVLRGINAGDKNYLIADGLRNEKEAVEIFLHEVVGHKAVLDMLGIVVACYSKLLGGIHTVT